MPSISFFLGVDTEYGDALDTHPTPQLVDMAELLVVLVRVDVPGDQFFPQGTATITCATKELRCGVAANLESTKGQSLCQLQRLEVSPAHVLVGGASGAVRFENVFRPPLQIRLALRLLATPSPASPDSSLAATWALRVVWIVFPHVLQLSLPRVNRLAADTQDPGDLDDATNADFLRFDRCVAPSVSLRQ